ncbi:MAG: hypothetical protein GY841_02115 [FCB group bacterium]|nr:hypothetical protein [FCB group bacterium]
MRIWLLLIFGLVALISVTAAAPDGGTQSPFALGVGARELSLGTASLAHCDIATAPIWNGSRLAEAEYYCFSGFHSRLFEADASIQYLGIVVPTLDYGVLALGLSRLGISGIERRDDANFLMGEFDDSRLALNLAYGRKISNYNIGLAFTLEHHSLDSYSATSTPGLNLSISRKFKFKKGRLNYLAVALTGLNLVRPGMKLVEEAVSYPYRADAGVSLGLLPFTGLNHRLDLSASVNKVDYLDPRFNAGLEYSFEDILFFRGGIRNERYSYGLGVEYKNIKFDYALVDRDLGSLHMFTLTSSLGSSVSVRRAERVMRREQEFDGLMDQQLTRRNREMVDKLTATGEKMLAEGDLVKAADSFDRALFMARNSGLDTLHIATLSIETSNQVDEISRENRYRQYIDSARVKLDEKDYLAAVQLANLARGERPASAEAAGILQQATTAIEQSSTLVETIRRGLWRSDSLLNYGYVDKALNIVTELNQLVPEDSEVKQALKKIKFEHWKETAVLAQTAAEYGKAGYAVDSALVLFPGHQWCLQMRRQIIADMRRAQEKSPVVVPVAPKSISPEILKQAELAYEAAQKYFKNGELQQAIEKWETVQRLAPNYQSVRKYLINAYKFIGVDFYGRNQLADAVTIWRKAAELDPDNSEISGYIRRTEAEIRKLSELSYEHE